MARRELTVLIRLDLEGWIGVESEMDGLGDLRFVQVSTEGVGEPLRDVGGRHVGSKGRSDDQ